MRLLTAKKPGKSFFSVPWRRLAYYAIGLLALWGVYLLWSPGRDVESSPHDLGVNGLWLQHGWIGDDLWYKRHDKEHLKPSFRDARPISELAERVRRHHIRDLYPHLAPSSPKGDLLEPDHDQLELLLDHLEHERVMPWVGGVYQEHVHADRPSWRAHFIADIVALLTRHPRLAGIHINIEPWPSGEEDLFTLLTELRQQLPEGKVLSLASYPPPVPVVGNELVHWTPEYITKLSGTVDQMVFMNYDSNMKLEKLYVLLQRWWVRSILESVSEKTQVLIGLPLYEDRWAPWHDPDVEHLQSSLAGLNEALHDLDDVPPSYRGVALYADWEISDEEWETFASWTTP